MKGTRSSHAHDRHERRIRPPVPQATRPWRGGLASRPPSCLPLLFLLIFGIIEVGVAMKSYSGASNAVRAGGRMASVAGQRRRRPTSRSWRGSAQEAAGIGDGEIEYVIIWHAAGPGDDPARRLPARHCRPVGAEHPSLGVVDGGPRTPRGLQHLPPARRPPAAPSTWRPAGRANPPAYYFGCTGASRPAGATRSTATGPGRNRKVTISPRGRHAGRRTAPDYVGVYIRAEHSYVTGHPRRARSRSPTAAINLLEPQGVLGDSMSRRSRPQSRRERGAALLEFALVLPFLLLMAFGMAEIGLAWVANNRVEGATSTAARIAVEQRRRDRGRPQHPRVAAGVAARRAARQPRPGGHLQAHRRRRHACPTACIKAVGSTEPDRASTRRVQHLHRRHRARRHHDDDLGSPPTTTGRRPPARTPSPDPPDYIGVWVRTTLRRHDRHASSTT